MHRYRRRPAGPSYALGRWLILSVESSGDRRTPYANRFTAQPEAVPYRPEWDTPLPKMAGVTHMRLDTSQPDNPYARLDPHGRYLAWHYFEHGQSQNGTGSAPLRLARDHAGPTYGQHFPVHRWQLSAQLDEPYCLSVVLHLQSANAAAFAPAASASLLRRHARLELQAQAAAFEPVHGWFQLYIANARDPSYGEGFYRLGNYTVYQQGTQKRVTVTPFPDIGR